MIDEEAARQAVDLVMATWPKPWNPDQEFAVWQVHEHARVWELRFATKRWVRTRAFVDVSVGSCPFLVDKTTGDVHLYDSAETEKFRAWLDE